MVRSRNFKLGLFGIAVLCVGITGCTSSKMLDAAERARIDPAEPSGLASFSPDVRGRVVGVSDGDTIKVLAPGNRELRIRFYGVDAPESSQAFGKNAKRFTSDCVFGRDVRVEVRDVDQYGRTVGKVFFNQDGVEKELNLELAKAGFGWWYRRYAPEAHDLEAAETAARLARQGLWADRNPTPPWDFRKAAKKR